VAAFITVRVTGGEQLRQALAKLNPATNGRIFSESVREIATKIGANAKNVQIRRGGGAVHPTQLTHRHIGSGLGSTIGPDFSGLPTYAEVGTNLFYGGIHEFGLNGHPRPFMKPALDAIEPEIPGIVVKNWKKEGGV